MSLSELLDNAPHSWANLRVNDLTVDGTVTPPVDTGEYFELEQYYSGNLWGPSKSVINRFYKIGNNVTLQMEGAIDTGTNTGSNIVMAENMPLRFVPHSIDGTNLENFTIPIAAYTANGYVDAHVLIGSTGGYSIRFVNAPGTILAGIDNISMSWNTSF
ncbi:MAG TPA: hypothetical protein VLZ83_14060 [Edaphocola sp.]|nr:hypothetical protein [Edaphocola sp.]